jgi:hypothetical protein
MRPTRMRLGCGRSDRASCVATGPLHVPGKGTFESARLRFSFPCPWCGGVAGQTTGAGARSGPGGGWVWACHVPGVCRLVCRDAVHRVMLSVMLHRVMLSSASMVSDSLVMVSDSVVSCEPSSSVSRHDTGSGQVSWARVRSCSKHSPPLPSASQSVGSTAVPTACHRAKPRLRRWVQGVRSGC